MPAVLIDNAPILIAAAAAVAVLVAAWLVHDSRSNRVPLERRRPPKPKKERRSLIAPAADALSKFVERLLAHRGRRLAAMLELAGVRMRVQEFVTLVFLTSITIFVLGLSLYPPLILAAALPAALGAGVVWALVAIRRKKFAVQLDDTLQLIASSLRAGQSLMQALASVARESEEPSASELGRIVTETRLGRSLDDSFSDVAFRMQSDDFASASSAIAINREVGGSLADVLDGVAKTIRERNEVRREVASLAAEGKLSAYILIALPPGMALFLFAINPTYLSPMFTTTPGIVMLVGAGVMLAAGALWLSKTIKVKF